MPCPLTIEYLKEDTTMYRKEAKRKIKLPTGTYKSIVKDIDYDPEYMDREAFFVCYELVNENGVKYDHREIFFNTWENDRSAELFEYWEMNGIPSDDIKAFKGCREKLTFKKTVKNNCSQLIIAQREFLGHFEEETA